MSLYYYIYIYILVRHSSTLQYSTVLAQYCTVILFVVTLLQHNRNTVDGRPAATAAQAQHGGDAADRPSHPPHLN